MERGVARPIAPLDGEAAAEPENDGGQDGTRVASREPRHQEVPPRRRIVPIEAPREVLAKEEKSGDRPDNKIGDRVTHQASSLAQTVDGDSSPEARLPISTAMGITWW